MNTFRNDESRIILVTGGAGYVGSVLLRKLLQNGYKVVCLDNLRYGGCSLIDIWDKPDFIFRKIDITDFQAVASIFESLKIFAVIHLAAIVGDPACKLEPDLSRKVNLDASVDLLAKAKEKGVRKFIFASTCSNYGKMKDSSGFVNEESPLSPVSLYAELKVGFENILLRKEGGDRDFSPTVLRFATAYGISSRMRFDLTVNEFTKELALGRELLVFGEQFWRPYCHVRDFSNAIQAVLTCPDDRAAYNVFNVGETTENYTKKMIVEEILKQIPRGRIKYVDKDEDPRDYRVNFDKIKKELGFRSLKNVPDGIREILIGIKMNLIENPDDPKYSNLPAPLPQAPHFST